MSAARDLRRYLRVVSAICAVGAGGIVAAYLAVFFAISALTTWGDGAYRDTYYVVIHPHGLLVAALALAALGLATWLAARDHDRRMED